MGVPTGPDIIITTGFYIGYYNRRPNSYVVYLLRGEGGIWVAQRVVFRGHHPQPPSTSAFATLLSVTFMDAVDH